MTQTLTTDELRQIVETDHTQCGDAAAMARELLANREAKPVMWAHERELSAAIGVTKDKSVAEAWAYEGLKVVSLYAAPPAQAVPDVDTIALEASRLVMHDVDRRDELNGGSCQLQARIQCRIEEACRAAMLAAAPEGGK